MPRRLKLSGVLYCIVFVWMGCWILGVERVLRNGGVFTGRGSNEYNVSPSVAWERGLDFTSQMRSWDLYRSLVQSGVPRNATYEAAEIPHVASEVSCRSCHIDAYSYPTEKPSWIRLSNAQGWFKSKLSIQETPPEDGEGKDCYGCLHELVRVKASALPENNRSFALFEGQTAAGVFFASGPNVPTGKAVVKVHCLNREGFLRHEVCSQDFIKFTENERAVRNIGKECGLEEVLTGAWVGPVNGMNGTDHLNTMGYWSEVAEGLSARAIWTQATRKMALQLINGLNSTQVIMAAMLDALTSQCDRNPNNAFISTSGKLTLIDNEKVLGVPSSCMRKYFGFRCHTRLNSLFIPGPSHGPVADSLDWESIKKEGESTIRRSRVKRNTVVGLDYRCHTPNGKIGVDFPPQMASCLQKFSKMSVSRVKREIFWGGLSWTSARELIGRSKDLLGLGFERAVMKWYAESTGPKFEEWGEPCCQMELVKGGAEYTCGFDK
ncbi:hypothetical protein BSKO_07071 [Bryopsis sp. KO-2023]|nr:hypothetical protein BSKO_07071 [Bryopsis sp. KO-2023]